MIGSPWKKKYAILNRLFLYLETKIQQVSQLGYFDYHRQTYHRKTNTGYLWWRISRDQVESFSSKFKKKSKFKSRHYKYIFIIHQQMSYNIRLKYIRVHVLIKRLAYFVGAATVVWNWSKITGKRVVHRKKDGCNIF